MVTNESVQYKVKKETVRETLQVRKTSKGLELRWQELVWLCSSWL
jgi:hypothetical protein